MYKYEDISVEEISLIKELWYKNRDYHKETSEDFSSDYNNIVFEERMKNLCSKLIKITLVRTEEAVSVAYCLSVIKNREAEVATLFVDGNHRKKGIARKLLDSHIQWFNQNNCDDISVSVLHNNESAIKLYEKSGFRKDIVKMRIASK